MRGTGAAAGDVGTPVAGKTGTTENSTDAWFIGYTPHLTTAVWMGYAAASTVHGRLPGHHQPERRHHPGPVVARLHERRPWPPTPSTQATFPPAYYLGGLTLSPPPASGLQFPLGLGTTTTTAPPTTTHHRPRPPPAPPPPRSRRRRPPAPRSRPSRRGPRPTTVRQTATTLSRRLTPGDRGTLSSAGGPPSPRSGGSQSAGVAGRAGVCRQALAAGRRAGRAGGPGVGGPAGPAGRGAERRPVAGGRGSTASCR